MIRNFQNNTIRISSITRSKLYSNINYILTVILNVSYIYEFSPRKIFRCVRISFEIPKLKYRNDAIKACLNATATDLKKLRMREIYKRIKSRNIAK
jgi:hypothetical protein